AAPRAGAEACAPRAYGLRHRADPRRRGRRRRAGADPCPARHQKTEGRAQGLGPRGPRAAAHPALRPGAGGLPMPELNMLAKAKPRAETYDEGALRQNAKVLEGVLAEFG